MAPDPTGRVGFARVTGRTGRKVFATDAAAAMGVALGADRAAICVAALRRMPFAKAPIESGKPPGVRGGRSEMQESSVSTSGTSPDETTKPDGSDAGVLSMMVRRVSAVVPWRA